MSPWTSHKLTIRVYTIITSGLFLFQVASSTPYTDVSSVLARKKWPIVCRNYLSTSTWDGTNQNSAFSVQRYLSFNHTHHRLKKKKKNNSLGHWNFTLCTWQVYKTSALVTEAAIGVFSVKNTKRPIKGRMV